VTHTHGSCDVTVTSHHGVPRCNHYDSRVVPPWNHVVTMVASSWNHSDSRVSRHDNDSRVIAQWPLVATLWLLRVTTQIRSSDSLWHDSSDSEQVSVESLWHTVATQWTTWVTVESLWSNVSLTVESLWLTCSSTVEHMVPLLESR